MLRITRFTLTSFVTVSFLLPNISLAQAVVDIDTTDVNNTSTCVTINNNLSYKNRKNNNKDDVAVLQEFLNDAGYLSVDSVTGFFGRITEKAVARFQIANRLVAVPAGFVGVGTRAKIHELSCGNITAQSVITNKEVQNPPVTKHVFKGVPFIKEVSSKGCGNGDLFAGQIGYVIGSGFTDAMLVKLGDKTLTTYFGDKDDRNVLFFVVPAYNTYPATTSIFVVNESGVSSNVYQVKIGELLTQEGINKLKPSSDSAPLVQSSSKFLPGCNSLVGYSSINGTSCGGVVPGPSILSVVSDANGRVTFTGDRLNADTVKILIDGIGVVVDMSHNGGRGISFIIPESFTNGDHTIKVIDSVTGVSNQMTFKLNKTINVLSSSNLPNLLPGCTSSIGFSSVDGRACGEVSAVNDMSASVKSGNSEPVMEKKIYPAGCSSYSGFSSVDGNACGGSTTQVSKVLGASTMCIDLPTNMHRGAESNDVKNLQLFLIAKGLLTESVTGFYGDSTVSAVRDYQLSKDLPVTGMVYDFTRQMIRVDSCK